VGGAIIQLAEKFPQRCAGGGKIGMESRKKWISRFSREGQIRRPEKLNTRINTQSSSRRDKKCEQASAQAKVGTSFGGSHRQRKLKIKCLGGGGGGERNQVH